MAPAATLPTAGPLVELEHVIAVGLDEDVAHVRGLRADALLEDVDRLLDLEETERGLETHLHREDDARRSEVEREELAPPRTPGVSEAIASMRMQILIGDRLADEQRVGALQEGRSQRP